MTGKVRFSMSNELVVDGLMMPPDTVIVDVRLSKIDFHSNRPIIEFVVIDKNLPEIPNHIPVPEVAPSVHSRNWCDECLRYRDFDWDWNYEEATYEDD